MKIIYFNRYWYKILSIGDNNKLNILIIILFWTDESRKFYIFKKLEQVQMEKKYLDTLLII